MNFLTEWSVFNKYYNLEQSKFSNLALKTCSIIDIFSFLLIKLISNFLYKQKICNKYYLGWFTADF